MQTLVEDLEMPIESGGTRATRSRNLVQSLLKDPTELQELRDANASKDGRYMRSCLLCAVPGSSTTCKLTPNREEEIGGRKNR